MTRAADRLARALRALVIATSASAYGFNERTDAWVVLEAYDKSKRRARKARRKPR